MEEQKKLTLKERWKKACTADNIVDFSVDVFSHTDCDESDTLVVE